MNFKGKKVLITGADGFIGSHLVEELVGLGAVVRAFVYYNSFNSWGWLDSIDPGTLKNIEVVPGDIRDFNKVNEAVIGCDYVFHLAALIAIPYSYSATESYLSTNINGTYNVLQACKIQNTSRVLITSTSEVYGTALYVPIDENHPKQGQSPYSASKIAADALSESYFNSFEVPLTIVRPFNTYGPRQSARAVIPTIISQLLSGALEIKLGALHPTRDLLYVKDTTKGYASVALNESLIGEHVNLSTQEEVSINDLALKLINHINPKATIISDDQRLRPVNSEVERLLGSNQKIKDHTGWSPQYSLDRGIKETIRWFRDKNNLKGYKAGIYNI